MKLALTAALIAAFLLPGHSAQADSYTIWIKAFIPATHPTNPGYMVPNPAGGSMIKDPLFGSKCYVTDNRTFNSDRNASARMTSQLRFDLDNSGLHNISDTENTGESHRVTCNDGKNECSDSAAKNNMAFGTPTFDAAQKIVFFSVDARASNPCFPVPNLAPNIHYKGQFSINLTQKSIGYTVEIGGFPSFEGYIQRNTGGAVVLFQIPPAKGSSVINIPDTRVIEKGIAF